VKNLVTKDEGVESHCQHTTPCSDCPWRRDSLNGWLGGHSAQEFVGIAKSDFPYPCHTVTNQQCAGMAIFRRNIIKMPRPPALILEKDKETVFANQDEFLAHHTFSKGHD
jgi:hypothetical protein